MTTKTQSVAEEVEAIREAVALGEGAYGPLHVAVRTLATCQSTDLEAIELWARLTADLAGLLRQK